MLIILNWFYLFNAASFYITINSSKPVELLNPISGVDALQNSISSANFLNLFPLFLLVIGTDFTKGTLKNILVSDFSRKKIFYTKFLVFSIFAFLQLALLEITNLLIVTLRYGFGKMTMTFFSQHLLAFIHQWWLLIAIFSFAYLLLIISKSRVTTILLTLVLFLFLALATRITQNSFLTYFDFAGNIQLAAKNTNEKYLIAAGFIIVTSLLASRIFQKQNN
ncbi:MULTISPECIES: hypothetical protein [unclassified Enterococcus]|uniref:hypothetical protein n=1 Tax=unclassified Enterococcus TaxID=2608891 RepID=UPI0024749DB2|nr:MULTISPECIES: hypothetical protein [unclassified Enterococcus]